MRVPFIVGNWKLNTLQAEAEALASGVAEGLHSLPEERVEAGVAPPFPWLTAVRRAAGDRLRVYAQNCAAEESGAFTGEVSAAMIRDAGADGVLVGHSERRHLFGEDDTLVARKAKVAQAAGLDVILCVGETLEERRADRTLAVVRRQVTAVLSADVDPARLVLAYEPVWAIGTGETATPEQAQEVHAAIRALVAEQLGAEVAGDVRIQYGGSAKPSNAGALLSMPDVDGLLVGGASLKAQDFVSMLSAGAGQRP